MLYVQNNVLRQEITQDPGANAWITNPEPITIIGSREWTNYKVTADARVVLDAPVGNGYVQVGARLGNVSSFGGKDGWNGGASGYFCRAMSNGSLALLAGGEEWRVLGVRSTGAHSDGARSSSLPSSSLSG